MELENVMKDSLGKEMMNKSLTGEAVNKNLMEESTNKNLMEEVTRKNLMERAIQAAEYAYVPYSHFHVGAAVLCPDGKIYTGCNIENASYGLTNCAERTAMFKAISEGERAFEAIAVYGCMEGQVPEDYAYPCGACRQVMTEFASPNMPVILVKDLEDYKVFALKELLPHAFSL